MARRMLVARATLLLEPTVAVVLTSRRTAAVATDRGSHPIRSAPAAGRGDRRRCQIQSCSLPTRAGAIRFETATSRRINPAHNTVGGCARSLREVACSEPEGDPRLAPLHNRVGIHTGLRESREAGKADCPSADAPPEPVSVANLPLSRIPSLGLRSGPPADWCAGVARHAPLREYGLSARRSPGA